MVLLEVAEIRTEPVSGAAVLLLREVDGRRHLALWIAEPERLAITDAINEEEPIRPYTHDRGAVRGRAAMRHHQG